MPNLFVHSGFLFLRFVIPCMSTGFLIYHLKNLTYEVHIPSFNVHGSVHRKNILIYIQQDATLRSSFYLETALHVSGGTTTHHQERKQLYPQQLVFFRPLLLSAVIIRIFTFLLTNYIHRIHYET
jgi:hypothetical protein